MFKKCYVAIIANDEGKNMGTVVARGYFFYSPKWFYDHISNALSNGNIVDFKRVK